MPIVVECACGKQLKAPDESAGKRAKCPACQSVVTLPAAAPPREEDDIYELADDPFGQLAPKAAPRPVAAPTAAAASAAQPRPASRPAAPAAPKHLMDSPFWQASAQRVIQRDAAAARGPKPLFNAFGIDVTRTKLSVAIAAVVVIIALPVWWVKLGPGADTKLLSAQTVEATPLLGGLATREPYSLVTGTGDRSLGLKGPKLKNPPPGAASVDIVYSIGGGEELFLTRPDPNGQHLLLQAHVSHGLMNFHGRQSNYEYRVAANDFTLEPLDGGEPLKAVMLYAEFDGGVEIDIGGSNAVSYEALLPVGVKPSSQELQRGYGGGVASGTVAYNGASGATGQFNFSSAYFMSGAPGVSGLSADGRVTRAMPDGSQVDYAYNGGTVDVSYTQGAARSAWWSKGLFTDPDGMNPWAKTRVTLLFDRPPGDAPHRLKYVDEVIATIHPAKAASTAGKIAAAAAAPAPAVAGAQPAPAEEEEEDTFIEPVTGYLKLLADARNKARGVVAMSNMNQIGLAIGMYAEANGGRMPASFEDLKTVVPAIDSVLVNQRTKENPGFIYERPAGYFAGIADPARTPILWESIDGKKDPDGSVLYADGHIESKYIP